MLVKGCKVDIPVNLTEIVCHMWLDFSAVHKKFPKGESDSKFLA